MSKGIGMKLGSTLILRAAVAAIGLIVAVLCVGLIFLIFDGDQNYRTPVWLSLLVVAVPFFVALFKAWKLLRLIDKNKAFTQTSVNALKNVRNCGLAICGLLIVASPYIMHVAQKDDAPGLFALALVVIGVSFVVATAAAVFQRLLQSAVDLKSENDLTV